MITNSRRRSARETFSHCAHRWDAEYRQGFVTDSLETRRGNAFHRAAELYIRSLKANQMTSDHGLAIDAITRAAGEWPLPFEEWTDLQSLWARWTEAFELQLHKHYDCETAIDFPPYSCKIRYDIVTVEDETTLVIEDLKTSFHIPNEEYLNSCLQTRLYCGAARRIFSGFDTYRMRYHFVRYGVTILTKPFTVTDLDAIDEWIATNDAAMDAAERDNVFPAHGTAICSTCKVKCPLIADHSKSDTVRLLTAQDALQAGALLSAVKTKAWTLTEALKGYCKVNGALEVGGMTYEHRPVDTTVFNARDVITVLDEHKETEFPLEFSKTAVSQLLKYQRYKHLRHDLGMLAKVTTTTHFNAKQTKLIQAEAEE